MADVARTGRPEFLFPLRNVSASGATDPAWARRHALRRRRATTLGVVFGGEPDGDKQALMTRAVDDAPPPGRLLVLAIQHVLTMYAGAVTVPLVIAGALHLAADQTPYLVSSDLVACGVVTLIQCVGVGFIGVRLQFVVV